MHLHFSKIWSATAHACTLYAGKILKNIGKVFGNDYILGVLMDTEKRIAGSIINHKNRWESRQP